MAASIALPTPRLVAKASVGAGLVLLATVAPFLWPIMDAPGRADAVFVLSGDRGERFAAAKELVERGVVPTLVFVGTRDRVMETDLCANPAGQGFEAICLRPQPDSTRAEARAAARLAASRGWSHIVVATSTYHLTRARLLFERCFHGKVYGVAGRPRFGVVQTARQVWHELLGVGQVLTVGWDCRA